MESWTELMISSWYGLLLGLLQGLTEFLPVSSSAHLVVAEHFIPGFGQGNLLFDTIVHSGTLVAVVIYFRKELWKLLRDASRALKIPSSKLDESQRASVRYIFYIVVATLPAGVFGILCKDSVEVLFASPNAAAGCLIITGLILAISDKFRMSGMTEGASNLTVYKALLIGFAQAIAITPGISRSGSTIAVGLMLGLAGSESATFSFLLSIPAILGAVVLQIPDVLDLISQHHTGAVTPHLMGFLAALVSGYAAVTLFIDYIKRHRLIWFSFYCWFFAACALALLHWYP